jgi:cathepsin D
LPNGLAIDEDGQDFSYFSVMRFGSKGQPMYMLIDSGSANTWVFDSDCPSSACLDHNTFGASDSNTLDITNNTWSLTYGTGEVTGVVASDTVAFANYSIDLGFGLAQTASNDFNYYPMDGILGLGRQSSNVLGVPTVMEELDSQNLLRSNIIGIHLQRSSTGDKDGQITFGGVDKSKFDFPLSYTNSMANDSNWEIPVGDAGVDGRQCQFTGKSAIVDTGTSYVLMPLQDALALHQLIPGSAHTGENFVIPCDATAIVQFTFSGVTYNVGPEDYLGKASGTTCASNIIGHQAFGPNQWILGDVFLKNVYTVFDFDKNRIGKRDYPYFVLLLIRLRIWDQGLILYHPIFIYTIFKSHFQSAHHFNEN